MIGDSERAGGERVEQAAGGVVRDVEQTRLTQSAVDVDRAGHVGDAVFGNHDDGRAGRADVVDQVAGDAVDRGGGGHGVGPRPPWRCRS